MDNPGLIAVIPAYNEENTVGAVIAEVQRTCSGPAEVRPAEVRPAEVRPVEERPEEGRPAEERPAEVRPVEVEVVD
ncbi:MAG: hypothetical protein OXN95_01115, partial [bacterium]|nr:hypothetical protein [bacterium]